MELVKKTNDYSIFKKKNNRFAVKTPRGAWINGDKKAEILVGEKLITVSIPKKVEEPAAETAEASAADSADAESTEVEAAAPAEEATEEKAE